MEQDQAKSQTMTTGSLTGNGGGIPAHDHYNANGGRLPRLIYKSFSLDDHARLLASDGDFDDVVHPYCGGDVYLASGNKWVCNKHLQTSHHWYRDIFDLLHHVSGDQSGQWASGSTFIWMNRYRHDRHSMSPTVRLNPSCSNRLESKIWKPFVEISGAEVTNPEVRCFDGGSDSSIYHVRAKTVSQIGFMLFLPFLIIDRLVVASVLMVIWAWWRCHRWLYLAI